MHESSEPHLGHLCGVTGQFLQPAGGRTVHGRIPQRHRSHRPHHEQPLHRAAPRKQTAQDLQRACTVGEEEAHALDRGPPYLLIRIHHPADEHLGTLTYHRQRVHMGSGLGAVRREVHPFGIHIQALLPDAEQQLDDRAPVRGYETAGHLEQERQAGRRARIDIPLMVRRTVEGAERLVPYTGVRRSHSLQPARNIARRTIGVAHGLPADAVDFVDHHAGHYAEGH
ncbi:hypothetical protein [Streptomyces sp. NPDC058629]|uniref:hypothetical protein n=1 Tax=Streptomyces sp. NPDC058629 TaxID=3346565 RepID=UPI00364B24DB